MLLMSRMHVQLLLHLESDLQLIQFGITEPRKIVPVRPQFKSELSNISFLISQLIRMLWVLKRTVSLRRDF